MSRTALRRARAATSIGAVALALVPACKKTPTLDFEISLPGDVASKVEWIEAGVFNGQICSSLAPQLPGGIPAEGYVARIAFSAGGPPPPILSSLPRAQYSVAVAARTSNCAIVAAGCANVDLASAKSVTVTLDDTPSPAQGACTSGDVCEDARCTPATNNGNTGVGAGCSLELLGAGPLADPLVAEGGGVTSAPAIAATSTGFLIGYREYQDTGLSRVTVVPVDESGGALAPQQAQQVACTQTQTSDATGIAFSGSSGVLVDARAACGTTGGIDLFALGSAGAIGSDGYADLGANPVQLSTAHAAAASPVGTLVAYVQSNTATLAAVNGGTLGTPTPFDAAESTDAWVGASDSVVALVSAGQGGSVLDAGSADDASAGAEAGSADDGGVPSDAAGTPTEDAALPGQVLRVNVIDVGDGGSPFGALPAPFTFAGTWASVSAQKGRVFVASDGPSAAAPVAYRAFDDGQSAPSVTGSFSTTDSGPVLYTDVAFHQDHVFFAVERQGSIALVAFDHATTTPTLLRTVELANDPRVPSLSDVRDGRIAVLATDSRVILAWTTQEILSSNDAAGGYAVFACTTP